MMELFITLAFAAMAFLILALLNIRTALIIRLGQAETHARMIKASLLHIADTWESRTALTRCEKLLDILDD